MKAAVVSVAGGPEVLELRDVPTPVPEPGQVLVRVKAIGLNRSEMFTRQGHYAGVVPFPRILGAECSGVVEAAPGGEFAPGTPVIAHSGGMGRSIDGSYAEFACLPARCVTAIERPLDWPRLAATSISFTTAYGALIDNLQIAPGQTLLIRGGTSSVGLTAASIAKERGVRVIASTRQESRRAALLANGASDVVIDDGTLAPAVRELVPGGVDCTFELIGPATLVDSMRCTRPLGVVCMAGIAGDAMSFHFNPQEMIPTGVRLTYHSSVTTPFEGNTRAARVQDFVDAISTGKYDVVIDRIFPFAEIVAAHRWMEESRAVGKIVVAVDV
jgi:NADPH2:quinone reductase